MSRAGAVADLDVAQNLRAGADQHAVADLGVTVARLLARAAERNALQNRDIILDDTGLADDQRRRVVEEHALADSRRRVDVDAESGRGAALQQQRKIAPPRRQHRVGEPVRLQRVKTFEVEQRLHHPQARGVAVGDRDQVGAERDPDGGVAGDDIVVFLADQRGRQIGMRQPLGDAIGDRVLQRVVIENGGHQEGAERGVALDRLLRFDAHAREQRVAAAEPDQFGDLRHKALPRKPGAILPRRRRAAKRMADS